MVIVAKRAAPGSGKRAGERTSIGVDPDARDLFNRYCNRQDRPAVKVIGQSVASQLIRWFVRQPEALQTAILDDVDERMEVAYAELLERLAVELRERAIASAGDRVTPPSRPVADLVREHEERVRRSGRGR